MTTTSKTAKSRNVFLTANKHQDKIVLMCFIPSLLIFLAFIALVFIGNPMVTKAIFHSSIPSMTNLIYMFTAAIVFILCLILVLSIMLSFVISHHIVGPFGRIIKELDDIVEGKSKRLITSRPGDDLAEDLLKRVNVLVKFYMEHKSSNNKD